MKRPEDETRPAVPEAEPEEPRAQPEEPEVAAEARQQDLAEEEADVSRPGRWDEWREAFAQAWDRARRGQPAEPAPPAEFRTRDRTGPLLWTGGSIVVVALLFLGLFSTERGLAPRTAPNLGRPALPATPPRSAGSVAPLIQAEPQAPEQENDLQADDIANTARKRNEKEGTSPGSVGAANPALRQIPRDPVLEHYRRAAAAYPLPPPPSPAPAPAAPGAGSNAAPVAKEADALLRPSLVFVRPPETAPLTNAPALAEHVPAREVLPAGTKLLARLEDAVSSAVKTPAIAVIEYHYERDGEIVVPAGTRAVGELQQAGAHGYVRLQFHGLEYADGRREKIEASAVDLDRGPLRGQVTGSGRGKRMLARTLTGIGTMAAYLVGGGGYRLGAPLDNSVFLRERLAQNIAVAGEQELASLSHSRQVVVTVPANTRFCLVLQTPAREAAPERR